MRERGVDSLGARRPVDGSDDKDEDEDDDDDDDAAAGCSFSARMRSRRARVAGDSAYERAVSSRRTTENDTPPEAQCGHVSAPSAAVAVAIAVGDGRSTRSEGSLSLAV